jgi:hypothetical protein
MPLVEGDFFEIAHRAAGSPYQNDILSLIQEIRRLEAEVERLRRIAKKYEQLQDILDELPIDIEDL